MRALLVRLLRRLTRSVRSSFAGAARTRLTADWLTSHKTPDQEVRADLVTLRSRSRELVRNNAWARRYIALVEANVIGPQGIRLQARLKTPDGALLESVNDQIEKAWRTWGRAGTCTADGRLSWAGAQRKIAAALAQDGEALVQLIRGFDNRFGFAIQLIEPDLLDADFNQPATRTLGEIRLGVEVDQWQRPIAYHLFGASPADWERSLPAQRQRVPATELIHLYDPERVNQTRGVPWFAPVMHNLHMLREYQEAELVSARIAAAKGGFFTRNSEDAPPAQEEEERLTMEVEPGIFDELPPGVAFTPWDPQHPARQYPDFIRAELRSVATGLDVSYASLTGDLSNTSFSSARVGMLQERDSWRSKQAFFIEHLHSRVHLAWAQQQLLEGTLDRRFDLQRLLEVEWQPRGWMWVDPKNEAEAALLALDNRLTSRRRVLAEQGVDYAEVLRDLAAEQALEAALGIGGGTDEEQAGDDATSDGRASVPLRIAGSGG